MAGEADQALLTYCDSYPNDENCKCMSSPENVSKIEDLMTLPKACWYKPCKNVSDNYLTSGMRTNRNNCTSTTCLIEAGDITVSGDGNSVSFANNCATSLLKDPSNSADVSDATEGNSTNGTTTDTTDNTTTTSSSLSNYLLPIGGGISLLCSSCCCILIIIVLLFLLM
jgi:hypothetical protein